MRVDGVLEILFVEFRKMSWFVGLGSKVFSMLREYQQVGVGPKKKPKQRKVMQLQEGHRAQHYARRGH